MSTLPPPATQKFPEDSVEKQVYNIVEKFAEYIPVANDRNRLGFSLFKFVTGEGDEPEISIKAAKIRVTGISEKQLSAKISDELKSLKK